MVLDHNAENNQTFVAKPAEKSPVRKRDTKEIEKQSTGAAEITWREASFNYLRHESDQLEPQYFYGGKRLSFKRIVNQIKQKKLVDQVTLQKWTIGLNCEFGDADKTPTHAFVEYLLNCSIVCKVNECPFNLTFERSGQAYKLKNVHELRHSFDAHREPFEER